MTERDAAEAWAVGAEYDDKVLARLGRVLKELGYQIDQPDWGVGGSQELSTWKAYSGAGMLLIEAETYVGVTVTGPRNLVDAVRWRFTEAKQ